MRAEIDCQPFRVRASASPNWTARFKAVPSVTTRRVSAGDSGPRSANRRADPLAYRCLRVRGPRGQAI